MEIVDLAPTGRTFHVLVNPEREVPEDAVRIHGHTTASLQGKPLFSAIADEFLAFVGEDRLVAHNAEFDMRFINAELAALGRPTISKERVIDTLALARAKHPGSPAGLDALCDRYRIDRSKRVKHGALLDSELLVEVYVELTGGRQKSLSFASQNKTAARAKAEKRAYPPRPSALAARLNEEELAAHAAATAKIGDAAGWLRYSAG